MNVGAAADPTPTIYESFSGVMPVGSHLLREFGMLAARVFD